MAVLESVVPDFLRGLVDDAALVRPGDAPLDDAVREHRRHLAAPYADLVGPLLVGDDTLPDLLRLLEVSGTEEPLAIAVVVSGGAGALEPAVRWATRSPRVSLRWVQIALRESDAGDLAPNTARVVTAVDRLLGDGLLDETVHVVIEPPPLHGSAPSSSWLGALDEVAAVDHRLTLRTGGEAALTSDELATCIEAALDRELSFTCTAGPEHAVRREGRDGELGRHGFLNVLAASRASLDGAGPAGVSAVLEETDPAALLAPGPDALTSARRWFTSFSSADVLEPLADLTALGLLS